MNAKDIIINALNNSHGEPVTVCTVPRKISGESIKTAAQGLGVECKYTGRRKGQRGQVSRYRVWARGGWATQTTDDAESEQAKLDAYIIADLQDDEGADLREALASEDVIEAKTAEVANSLALAGLADVDDDGITFELTPRGERIARMLAA